MLRQSAHHVKARLRSEVDLQAWAIYPSCSEGISAAAVLNSLNPCFYRYFDRSTYLFHAETVIWPSNQQHRHEAPKVQPSRSR